MFMGFLLALVMTMNRILSHHALEGNREKPCQYRYESDEIRDR